MSVVDERPSTPSSTTSSSMTSMTSSLSSRRNSRIPKLNRAASLRERHKRFSLDSSPINRISENESTPSVESKNSVAVSRSRSFIINRKPIAEQTCNNALSKTCEYVNSHRKQKSLQTTNDNNVQNDDKCKGSGDPLRGCCVGRSRNILHCSHGGIEEEYLTPTQRSARKIKHLQNELKAVRTQLSSKDNEVCSLTKDLVVLRMRDAEDNHNTTNQEKKKMTNLRLNLTTDSGGENSFSSLRAAPFENGDFDQRSPVEVSKNGSTNK